MTSGCVEVRVLVLVHGVPHPNCKRPKVVAAASDISGTTKNCNVYAVIISSSNRKAPSSFRPDIQAHQQAS